MHCTIFNLLCIYTCFNTNERLEKETDCFIILKIIFIIVIIQLKSVSSSQPFTSSLLTTRRFSTVRTDRFTTTRSRDLPLNMKTTTTTLTTTKSQIKTTATSITTIKPPVKTSPHSKSKFVML